MNIICNPHFNALVIAQAEIQTPTSVLLQLIVSTIPARVNSTYPSEYNISELVQC
jgi:hypothetical protein